MWVASKTNRATSTTRRTSSPALGALPVSLSPATETARGLGIEITQAQFPKLTWDWLAP